MGKYEGFISVYQCGVCERKIGLYFDWDETECEDEASVCPVCQSDDVTFIQDVREKERA